MTTLPNIVEAMGHPGLFQPWFNGASWDGWRAVLSAAHGLATSDIDRAFLRRVADRDPPGRRVRELWCIIGRRGGKDSAASLIAAHSAASFNPTGVLRPGERALVVCVACDKDQAKIVWRFIKAFFDAIPPLAAMVERVAESDGVIELHNQVDIVVATGSYRAVRGRPILTAILDECAFYRDETSSTPDTELYRSLLPGMATIPGAMMIGISSPHKQSGLLFERWKRHYAGDSNDVLVIRAPSQIMNPVLDVRDRDRQMVEDAAAARAEWYAEWRDDLSTFVDPIVVDRCVFKGRTEMPPVHGTRYTAAVDPSGGSSDSMTLAIAHAVGDRGILDLVREWKPPFSPEQVVSEIAAILRSYGINAVVGDAYAGEWPRERFRTYGVDYQLAGMSRSEAYLTFLPALNTPGQLELLDNTRLVSQLCALERRTTRGGRDTVDHPSGGHDDVINSAALALVGAALAPKGAAEGWIEFLRRELEEPSRRNTDLDRVRAAGPDFKFAFISEPSVELTVPPTLARGLIEGRCPKWNGDKASIDLPLSKARQFLEESPAFRQLNRHLATQLGIKVPEVVP